MPKQIDGLPSSSRYHYHIYRVQMHKLIVTFTFRNGLSTQTKEISFLEVSPDETQISREERAFRFWINSLGNSTYIDNVFEDLRNGLVSMFYSHNYKNLVSRYLFQIE